jgi:hypothetical protein
MTHLAAGRHRLVMARPMRPSMLVGVTRLHPAIATSTGRIARSLLFTTASSHVKIFSVNSAQNHAQGRILLELRATRKYCKARGQQHAKGHAPVAIAARLSEHALCGSAPLPVWPILRGAGTSDCGNRLLPRRAQPDALASALAIPKRSSPRFQKPKAKATQEVLWVSHPPTSKLADAPRSVNLFT